MENNTKNKKPSPHKGHRNRLRQKVMKYGIDSLAQHEVMELILFNSIAQKNTNDLAHALIDEFGSVSRVLDAPAELLIKIKGISETTVLMLKSIPQIARYYMQDKNVEKFVKITNNDEVYDYIKDMYIGEVVEVARAIYLSNAGRILGCEVLSRGIVNSTQVNARQVVEHCIKYNATQVILVHNHPSGNAHPSGDDFVITKNVCIALKSINSRLTDHLIIANDECISMAKNKVFARSFEV